MSERKTSDADGTQGEEAVLLGYFFSVFVPPTHVYLELITREVIRRGLERIWTLSIVYISNGSTVRFCAVGWIDLLSFCS